MGDYKLIFGKPVKHVYWYDLDLGVAKCVRLIDKVPGISKRKRKIYKERFISFDIAVKPLKI